MRVHLNWYEVLYGAYVGVMRKVQSLKDGGLGSRHSGNPWDRDIEGALAESAVAKALGIYFPASINTFKAPDLGKNYQVKRTGDYNRCLIVRPGDNDDEIAILDVGKTADHELVGWLRQGDAKTDKYKANPNETGEAYFVPIADLHPMSELPR